MDGISLAVYLNTSYETTAMEPRPSSGRGNDVYADRTGVVYREESDGSWSRRENGKWKSSPPPSTGGSATQEQSSSGSSLSGRTTIEEDAEARRRGEERVADRQETTP